MSKRTVEFLARFLTVDDMRAKHNFAFQFACWYGHLPIVEFLSRFLTVDEMRACDITACESPST